MLSWWSEKFDKMSGTLSVFSLAVEWAAFDSLIVCTSSTLQLVHWVPEQRLWNGILCLSFAVPWRPCRQASPQKHAWGSRLFAKRPMMRNWTKNNLNIFPFLIRFFSILYSSKKATGAKQLPGFYNTSAECYSSGNSLFQESMAPNIVALWPFRISRFATINLLDSHDADISSWISQLEQGIWQTIFLFFSIIRLAGSNHIIYSGCL